MPMKKDQPELDLDTESEDFYLDNSTFTFRVNSDLKAEFQKLCKRDRYSSAAVLKRFMIEAVRRKKVDPPHYTIG